MESGGNTARLLPFVDSLLKPREDLLVLAHCQGTGDAVLSDAQVRRLLQNFQDKAYDDCQIRAEVAALTTARPGLRWPGNRPPSAHRQRALAAMRRLLWLGGERGG